MKTIEHVIKKELCTGCGVCSSVFYGKIEIQNADYNRPVVNQKLSKTETKIFNQICPGINQASISGKNVHPVWGPVQSAGIGFSNDAEIRYRGSSGGIVTQTLLYALDSKLADMVVQIASDINNPIENIVKISKSRNDLIEATGSRYSPSSPLLNIIQIVNDNPNKKIAFVGKPCDCVALRNLMSINDDVNRSITLIVSFFCAGTPSRTGVKKVLEALEYDNNKPVNDFYYRGKGWPGKTTLVQNSSINAIDYSKSWGSLLGPTIQNRCKLCADGTGEVADIVSADVWHCDSRGYPIFTESDGQGLVLARSTLGRELVSQMMEKKLISVSPYNMDDLANVQITQFERKSTILVRGLAKMIGDFTIIKFPKQRIFIVFSNLSIYKQIRVFTGSLLRVLKGKM